MADYDETPEYGAWLPEQTEQDKQAAVLKAQRLEASVPVIQDVLDWFDKQIATYKNPLTIEGVNPSTDAETVKSAVLFAQSMIRDYKHQKDQFAGQFAEYLKPKQADEA